MRLLLALLVGLGAAPARADGGPSFIREYRITARVCPIRHWARDTLDAFLKIDRCQAYAGDRIYDSLMWCQSAIAVDGPLMARLLAIPPAAYGIAARELRVTLTCIPVTDGRHAAL